MATKTYTSESQWFVYSTAIFLAAKNVNELPYIFFIKFRDFNFASHKEYYRILVCFFLSISSELEFLKPNATNEKLLGNNTHLLMR